MNILLVGGGGREHALAWKLSTSPRVTKLYAMPGSAAIAEVAECVTLEGLEAGGFPAIADFAKQASIDLVVVGPEPPLVAGLADLLTDRGLRVFGPTAAAACLEGSKVFSKRFMERHGIPTAPFQTFSDIEPAKAYVRELGGQCVVKADGLAAGKGAIVCRDAEEADAALHTILIERAFGDAGNEVVVEAFMPGEEASYFAVCDGKDFIAFPSAQDHKPVGDLDRGPNTGGMGAYCPAPVVTPQVEQRVIDEILRPTLDGMIAEGSPYQGVLYVGLMIEDGTPRVVEFNCRFGDPETQPQMMMLESDLLEMFEAAVEGNIARVKPVWKEGTAACIVMASGGYPGAYKTGLPIEGLESLPSGAEYRVFHAGTARDKDSWVTKGGRVLGVTARGDTLGEALEQGYRAVAGIRWQGAIFRKDIGLKGMKHENHGRPKVNVGIVVGSASDLDVARKATAVLEQLGVGYELAVASAHRTPDRTRAYVAACLEAGAEVFIAMAGMAAALPGVVAAETEKPVIGVPIKSSAFEGMDAMLSIAQMPPGIPVATVAVGGGVNAALLAAQVLAVKYPDVAAALKEYRLGQAQKVAESHKDAGLSTLIG